MSVYLLCVGDWLCMRHRCDTCGEAATVMCVFCPVSYCDQHVDGKIKRRTFWVSSHCRTQHRVCLAHKSQPFNTAKMQRRHSTKLKARSVPDSQDNRMAEPEIPAHVGSADSGSVVEEKLGTRDMNESAMEASMSLQKPGNGDDDAKVMAHGEVEKLNSKHHIQGHQLDALSRHTSLSRQQRLQVRHSPDQKRKLIAVELCKKNGIVLDVAEAGNSSDLAVEQDLCQIDGDTSSRVEDLPKFNTEKSPGKRCRAAVVNGFHSSVAMSTRRRSTLQDNSQTLNVPTVKLEPPVNDAVADTVSTLLEEFSESSDVKLMNGNGLEIDNN